MKSLELISAAIPALLAQHVFAGNHNIDRERVVSRFNPKRKSNLGETPMQVGNGNLAFGADITGLQSISPFGTLSSWGWHNVSLPTVPGQTSPEDFTGMDWWTHGRLVNYAQPNPAEANISQWLISNPHRINLVRIGFLYQDRNITVDDLADTVQTLDLYEGKIHSQFNLDGEAVDVWTTVDPCILRAFGWKPQPKCLFRLSLCHREQQIRRPFRGCLGCGIESHDDTALSESSGPGLDTT